MMLETMQSEKGSKRDDPSVSLRETVFNERWFVILLALLLVYIVLSILVEGTEHQTLLRATLLSLVLLAALACLRFMRGVVVLTRWFGVATLLCGWVPIVVDSPAFVIMSTAFRIVFFLMVTAALIYRVATSAVVTMGIIVGAIDGYLLLGIIGAGAFLIVETASPGSFLPAGASLAHSDHVYYAFITMSTVGYGDIVPIAPMARSIAVLLAVTGQIYIAVLLALLVGKYAGARK